ncbi:MAG: ABC transporter substrate-binding protein [Micromonosporaceae bacterium]|nr:ABC transporter substrate-binding protein [Micromonosporaceae bacterium]
MSELNRRGFLRLTGAAAATSVLASACSGSSLGGSEADAGGPVKIGLLLPDAGVYKGLGDDQRNGWKLFLEQNGGKLGGREVKVVTADEGEEPDTAKAGAEKLLKQERCQAVCGVISSGSLVAIQEMFTAAKVPLISTNASPTQVQGKEYGWRTSFVNDHPSVAFGEYLAKNVGGPISLIVADYAAGHDHIKALDTSFKPAGGELAGKPILAPFPIGGRSFQPYLQQIEKQKPKAVYCFFAGADAVKFVKEYKKFGLADKYQLYAPGWLTEGGVLAAQGEAAVGILNSLNYSTDLDNAANQKFVSAFTKAYDQPPTAFSVAAYDAGLVLDRAIAAAGEKATAEAIERQLGKLGEIDSPRGAWKFGQNRSPVQKWYLRKVEKRGDAITNVVIEELGTPGE